MSSDQSLNTLSNLLIRQLSDGLNDEEHARLKEWLTKDAEARQYYVEFMALNAQLRKQRVASVTSPTLDFDFSEDNPNFVEDFARLLQETDQGSKAQCNVIFKVLDPGYPNTGGGYNFVQGNRWTNGSLDLVYLYFVIAQGFDNTVLIADQFFFTDHRIVR